MKPGTEGLFVAVQDTLKLQMSVSVSVIILKHNVYFHSQLLSTCTVQNAAYHHVSEDGATTILECVSALVDGLDLLVVLV